METPLYGNFGTHHESCSFIISDSQDLSFDGQIGNDACSSFHHSSMVLTQLSTDWLWFHFIILSNIQRRSGHWLAGEGSPRSVHEPPQSPGWELSTLEAVSASGHTKAVYRPWWSCLAILLLLGRLRLHVRRLQGNGSSLLLSRSEFNLYNARVRIELKC